MEITDRRRLMERCMTRYSERPGSLDMNRGDFLSSGLSKLNFRVPLLARLRASSALKNQVPTVKTLLLRRLRSNGTQPTI